MDSNKKTTIEHVNKQYYSSEHSAESSDESVETAQLSKIIGLVKEILNKNHEYSFKLIEFIEKSTKLNELPNSSMNDSEPIESASDIVTKHSLEKILQSEIAEIAKEMLNKNNEYALKLNTIIEESTKSNDLPVSPMNASPVSSPMDVSEPVESASDIPILTKITSLTTDCMESIFENLDMYDLINVVDSNKQFYAAAFHVFRRKYKDTYFILGSDISLSKRDYAAGFRSFSRDPKIIITNPSVALKFLRNFGCIFEELTISFSFFHVNICTQIEYYLAEFCANTLKRLSLECNKSKNLFEGLHNQLKQVTSLQICLVNSESRLELTQHCLEKLPSLQYFNVVNNMAIFHGPLSNFPLRTVQHLKIDNFGTIMYKNPFDLKNLKHLCINGEIIITEYMNRSFGAAENLVTLKLMEIEDYFAKDFEDFWELPNILSNIEEITIDLNRDINSEHILRFLERCQRLKKMALLKHRGRGSDILENITSNLSNEWTFHVINPFIEHCKYCECYVIERLESTTETTTRTQTSVLGNLFENCVN
ncbi:uncharacterized protein LOC129580125, partial [Sitodiplosis mosellana]|uniref:uncharacterized protein LOC129580125 n=1 Tax=Sitodiplosis mosellana TaxID=263140 RepID=UPI0024449689